MDMQGLLRNRSYDPRAVTTAGLGQTIMASHYLPSIGFSNPSTSSILGQQPHPFGFNSFAPGSSGVMGTYGANSFVPPTERRCLIPDSDRLRDLPYASGGRSNFVDQRTSTGVKHETSPRTSQPSQPPPGREKENEVLFQTPVDVLVKAVQSAQKTDDKKDKERQSQPKSLKSTASGKVTKKRYICDRAGCEKGFTQKTHLDIHIRRHTGAKPYPCPHPGCGQSFSQLGNLKTHERRHTGERPYQCDICGKAFAQSGNVQAHKSVHEKTKPFRCTLDGCNKDFSQLGNLKSHQNKFHVQTLATLTQRFANYANLQAIPESERALFEYFSRLYKYSNKGIKGRGKDRKVGSMSSAPSAMSIIPNSMVGLGNRLPHVPAYSHPTYENPARDRNVRDGSNSGSVIGYDMFDEGTHSPSESSTASYYGVESSQDQFATNGRDLGYHRVY